MKIHPPGALKTQNGDVPGQAHPLRRIVRLSYKTPIPKTKAIQARNRVKVGIRKYVVRQQGITGTRNFVSAKRSARESEQTQLADEKAAQSVGRVTAILLPSLYITSANMCSDSDPSEEPLSRTTSSKGADPSSFPTTSSLPPPQEPPPSKPSHKKTGRPPARRGRVGRNQYTKDRDSRPDGSVNADNNTSPARSRSGDGDDQPHTNGHNYHSNNHNENGKASKPRYMNPNRTSMNDMKRRVAGILDFISRTQVEMAGTEMTSRTMTTSPPDHGGGNKALGQLLMSELEDGLDGFGKLSSVEMMEVLTRRLMRWQGEYGKLGEK